MESVYTAILIHCSSDYVQSVARLRFLCKCQENTSERQCIRGFCSEQLGNNETDKKPGRSLMYLTKLIGFVKIQAQRFRRRRKISVTSNVTSESLIALKRTEQGRMTSAPARR